MEKVKMNGLYPCKILEETVTQITETHETMGSIHEDIKHLKTISDTLAEIKDGLLKAVMGKDIVPIGVTQSLLDAQRVAYVSIIKMLLLAFSSIILVLVGLKYLALHLFGA